MSIQRASGTSRAAKIFVAVVCVVIVALEIWSAWRERDVKLEEAARASSNMTLALAQHADQTLNEVDTVLRGVQEHLDLDGVSVHGRTRIHDFMVMHVQSLPQLAGLFYYDEKGRWVVNSQPMLETRFNNAAHDYFIYHREHRTDKPFVGAPMRSQSTGQWVLTISRRLNHIDGSFAGVVLGTIDLSYFDRFYGQIDIGRNGAIMFGTNAGRVILRRPLLADSIGKDIAATPLFADYVQRYRAGSVELRSTQDGVVRIISYQHPASYPLFISVALGKDDVLEDWSRHVWGRSIGVALLLIILCYGGTRLVAQVAYREAAERKAIEARQEIEQLYRTLELQSQKDGLTEVFNRRFLDNALVAELARFRRSGGTLSVLMIDVDHFKLFNDTYGHAAGDICLQKVAATISAAAQRQGDMVARYGGEEFAMILPACDKRGAKAVARNLLGTMRAMALPHQSSPSGSVTISIGIATLSAERGFKVGAREIIEVADAALYLAKGQGRDQAVHRDYPIETDVDQACLSE